MNKIDKSLNIIYNNLPYKYHIPVKIYTHCKQAIVDIAKKYNNSYKKQITYYNNYLDNPPNTNYINTKYYRSKNGYEKSTKALDITAFGGSPIILIKENVKRYTIKEIIFILLHEIGHNVLYTGKYHQDERTCDLFAIRWIRKLVNKGVIKKYWEEKCYI